MNKHTPWLVAVLLVVLLALLFGSRPSPTGPDPEPPAPTDLPAGPDEPAPAPPANPASPAEDALPLPPERTALYGRVTTEEGKPIPGAVIEVRDWYDVVDGPDLDRAEDLLVPDSKLVVTEDGAWALRRPPGRARLVVTVRAPGYVPVIWETEEIPVEPVAARRDVRLRPAGTISGRVLDPDGTPVAGAHVHAIEVEALREHQADDDLPADRPMIAARDLLWGDGRWDESVHYRRTFAVADGDGRFRLPEADPAEEYALLAVAESHGLSALMEGIRPSGVDDGHPVELRLRKMAGIRVRVIDSAGRTVSDADVDSAGSPRGGLMFGTDPEGVRFRQVIDPGVQRLSISVPGWPEFSHDVELKPGVMTDTEARMEGGCVVSGVVLDEQDRPITGAEIQLQVEPPGDASDCTVTRTGTDEEGRFRLVGNPKGTGSMWISRIGYEEIVLRDLEVPGPDLRIHLRNAGTVLVEVKPPEGTARTKWIHVAIRSVRPGHEPGSWSTDFTHWAGEEEPLRIEGVPTGGAEIRLWAPGCRLVTVRADVTAGATGPLGPVQLPRAPRLVVIIVDERKEPVAGARLGFDGDRDPPVDWRDVGAVTDEDGRATIHFPVDEPLSMYVGAPGRKGIRHTVEAGDTPVRLRAGAKK